MSATTYRDLLPVVIEEAGAVLPEGYDSWGIKSIHPDLVTTRGFRWAPPGGTSISADHLDPSNADACPSRPGDGLCVATTWLGMASGGIPARMLLLVAYRSADVVGRDDTMGKLRIGGEVASVAVVDGERLVREHGRGAGLRGAVLRGADLRFANLRRAGLQGADLRFAGLQGADLRFAGLRGADLRFADLQGADLQGADLRFAGLRFAGLRFADLQGADLQGADLQDADLQDARWALCYPPPDGWTLTDAGTLTRAGGAA